VDNFIKSECDTTTFITVNNKLRIYQSCVTPDLPCMQVEDVDDGVGPVVRRHRPNSEGGHFGTRVKDKLINFGHHDLVAPYYIVAPINAHRAIRKRF